MESVTIDQTKTFLADLIDKYSNKSRALAVSSLRFFFKRVLDRPDVFVKLEVPKKEKKLPFIEKAIVRLDILKVLIRLAKDINALSSEKYLELESILQEIGRMLGGWKKSLLSPKHY